MIKHFFNLNMEEIPKSKTNIDFKKHKSKASQLFHEQKYVDAIYFYQEALKSFEKESKKQDNLQEKVFIVRFYNF